MTKVALIYEYFQAYKTVCE